MVNIFILHWSDLVRSDVDWSIAIHIRYKFSCDVLLMSGKYYHIAICILRQNRVSCGNALMK